MWGRRDDVKVEGFCGGGVMWGSGDDVREGFCGRGDDVGMAYIFSPWLVGLKVARNSFQHISKLRF